MASYLNWSDEMLELMLSLSPPDLLRPTDDPPGRIPPLFSLAMNGNTDILRLLRDMDRENQSLLWSSPVHVSEFFEMGFEVIS